MVSSKLCVDHLWLLGGFLVLVTIVATVVGVLLAVVLLVVSVMPVFVTQAALVGVLTWRAVCWIGRWVEGL
jgi:hypothetical protein